MVKLSIANLIIARRWLVLVTASMGLYLVLPERGLAQNNQGQNDQGINLVVPKGAYAFRDTGQVTRKSISRRSFSRQNYPASTGG